MLGLEKRLKNTVYIRPTTKQPRLDHNNHELTQSPWDGHHSSCCSFLLVAQHYQEHSALHVPPSVAWDQDQPDLKKKTSVRMTNNSLQHH